MDLTTLFFFDGNNGTFPEALMLSSDGALYRVTSQGGADAGEAGADGTVFKLPLQTP